MFRPSIFTIHYFLAHYSLFIIKKDHYSLIIIHYPDPHPCGEGVFAALLPKNNEMIKNNFLGSLKVFCFCYSKSLKYLSFSRPQIPKTINQFSLKSFLTGGLNWHLDLLILIFWFFLFTDNNRQQRSKTANKPTTNKFFLKRYFKIKRDTLETFI